LRLRKGFSKKQAERLTFSSRGCFNFGGQRDKDRARYLWILSHRENSSSMRTLINNHRLLTRLNHHHHHHHHHKCDSRILISLAV
jgi:hypothetical protein